jgi:hypothetical protein
MENWFSTSMPADCDIPQSRPIFYWEYSHRGIDRRIVSMVVCNSTRSKRPLANDFTPKFLTRGAFISTDLQP